MTTSNNSASTSGALWCWGYNAFGQVGDGTRFDRHSPVQVGDASNWSSVAVGEFHARGIAAGKLSCWGYNGDSEIGDGTTDNALAPLPIGSASNWTAVSPGGQHACAIGGGVLSCGVRTRSVSSATARPSRTALPPR